MIFLWIWLVFSLAAQDEHGLRRAQQNLNGVGTRGGSTPFFCWETASVGQEKALKAQGRKDGDVELIFHVFLSRLCHR